MFGVRNFSWPNSFGFGKRVLAFNSQPLHKFCRCWRQAQVRQSVKALCKQYPGEYWRKLDATSTYPHEFVDALQDAGFLSMLIPEQYGGSGSSLVETAQVLEEVQAAGCNGGAAHAQMYVMGTILRHGSEAQKEEWLPQIVRASL
jgi:alkylation response protein AidB-like acyl-CoA dehydrogenase